MSITPRSPSVLENTELHRFLSAVSCFFFFLVTASRTLNSRWQTEDNSPWREEYDKVCPVSSFLLCNGLGPDLQMAPRVNYTKES